MADVVSEDGKRPVCLRFSIVNKIDLSSQVNAFFRRFLRHCIPRGPMLPDFSICLPGNLVAGDTFLICPSCSSGLLEAFPECKHQFYVAL